MPETEFLPFVPPAWWAPFEAQFPAKPRPVTPPPPEPEPLPPAATDPAGLFATIPGNDFAATQAAWDAAGWTPPPAPGLMSDTYNPQEVHAA